MAAISANFSGFSIDNSQGKIAALSTGNFSNFSINNSQGKIATVLGKLSSPLINNNQGKISNFSTTIKQSSNNYFTTVTILQQGIPVPLLKSALNLDILSNTTGKAVDKILVLSTPQEYLKTLNFINKFKISASDSIAIYSSSTKVPIQFWS